METRADAVRRALAAVSAAEDMLSTLVRRLYPVGDGISWELGSHLHTGAVIRHGYGGRVYVRNIDTDKRRWIHPHWIA